METTAYTDFISLTFAGISYTNSSLVTFEAKGATDAISTSPETSPVSTEGRAESSAKTIPEENIIKNKNTVKNTSLFLNFIIYLHYMKKAMNNSHIKFNFFIINIIN